MTGLTATGLRSRWAAGRAAHGVWSQLPGVVTAELLARTAPDYVVLDLQHGALAEADLPGVTAVIAAAGVVPLVRTRSAHFADVGRPLDLGAQGVIVPNVRGADHVREVVSACRYAPAGTRSAGRLSGGSDAPLVLVMIETAEALDDLDAVLAADGLDGVYVGPRDLGLVLGRSDPADHDRLQEVLASIIARAVAAGVPVGVHAPAGSAQAVRYAAQGATIVTAAVDTVSLTGAVAQHLDHVRASADPQPS